MEEIEIRADRNLIEICRDTTFGEIYTVYNNDIETDDNLSDLTGKTAKMSLRPDYNSDPIITLTTENGGIALGGAAGTITLSIPASNTAALPIGRGVYDFKLITARTPEADVTELFSGPYAVTRTATRSTNV